MISNFDFANLAQPSWIFDITICDIKLYPHLDNFQDEWQRYIETLMQIIPFERIESRIYWRSQFVTSKDHKTELMLS